MANHENRNENAATQLVLCIAIVSALVLAGIFVDSYYASGALYWNVTTRLNVTNTEPMMYNVILDDLTDVPPEVIILNAGGYSEVLCNGSAYDPNGQSDLFNATAIIYATNAKFQPGLSNFNKYLNQTCNESYNVPGTTMNRSFICRFKVEYWAENTTWECNMTIRDHGGTQLPSAGITSINTSGTDTAVVYSLTAINVSSPILDFGNLSVTDTSTMKALNVTNVGNVNTNYTLYGYGGNESTLSNANLTCMLCYMGNISVQYMRWSNVSNANYDDMIMLNSTVQKVTRAVLLNRTDDATPVSIGTTANTTYWRIRVPLSVGGMCNGTIEFSATSASSA
jgi:hypothetical protein